MIEYFWLDDEKPILSQLQIGCKSAAILLHPFIEMPKLWIEKNHERNFPNDEECIKEGKSVSWKNVIKTTGLESYKQVGTALATSIGALRKEFANENYKQILENDIASNRFFPSEDEISPMLYKKILKFLSKKGASHVEYYNPYSKEMKSYTIDDINPDMLLKLEMQESVICDNRNDYIFMGIFDQFYTLMISKSENIDEALETIGAETILCDDKTKVFWYLD